MATDCAGRCARCETLERRVAALEAENERLRKKFPGYSPESEPEASACDVKPVQTKPYADTARASLAFSPLSRLEMQRYGRQMLVSDFGIAAQLRLRSARVLVIGAGGLGCPVAIYLAAMGVGCLGIVDNDRVEQSNLHRQVAHDESTLGMHKAHSIARRLRLLNPCVSVEPLVTRFSHANASSLVDKYDVIVDASDNPETRYLVNQVCARSRTPLVSGSALGFEGQVSVFTYADDEAACYQCLYPSPPRSPQNCEENGVLGIVPGIIGCVQALETVKVITAVGKVPLATQLHFDAYDSHFRRIKISNGRRPDCFGCSASPARPLVPALALNHVPPAITLPTAQDPASNISVHELAVLREKPDDYVLIDTRAPHQFEIVHFPEAINLPFDDLKRAKAKGLFIELMEKRLSAYASEHTGPGGEVDKHILVICRRGVDSAIVTAWLHASGFPAAFNVEGGYVQYADERSGVDGTFPMY